VKVSIAFPRASHDNSRTAVEYEELPWPQTTGRVMRHRLLHLETDGRGETTHYGGLVLAQQLVRRLGIAQRLDQGLLLFKRHAPYYESDHVLAMTYTLYADGTCLEDQGARCREARRCGGWWERAGSRTRPRRAIFCAASRLPRRSNSSRL